MNHKTPTFEDFVSFATQLREIERRVLSLDIEALRNTQYTHLEGNHMHAYPCIRLKHKSYRYRFYLFMHNLKLNICMHNLEFNICMIAKLTFLEGVV